MSEDDAAMLWGELFADVLRRGPRLEIRFGTCPSCDLGASDACDIGGVTWAYCISCMVRWPVLEPLARLDPPPDQFLELFVETLSLCIDLDPEGISPPAFHREEPMKPRTSTPHGLNIDVAAYRTPRDMPLLPDVTSAQRVRIVDLVVPDLRAHPPTRNPRTGRVVINVHGMWERLRNTKVDPDHTLEDLIGRKNPASIGPTYELGKLCNLLLDLRDRRAQLLEELEKIDAIASAFEPMEEKGA